MDIVQTLFTIVRSYMSILGMLGIVSLKLLGGKISPKLVCFVLKKKFLILSETASMNRNHICIYQQPTMGALSLGDVILRVHYVCI